MRNQNLREPHARRQRRHRDCADAATPLWKWLPPMRLYVSPAADAASVSISKPSKAVPVVLAPPRPRYSSMKPTEGDAACRLPSCDGGVAMTACRTAGSC